ncbi:hypothetical protein L6452_04793 [Arctium lappa]|uniref:Uncharacterized protein n=1 Tax=Arctium lappa TaxID=4217 RepID=A0ACB9EE73_ARCLA|nr:hypothetical protein L6452_04793 [Arctium lappa]
MNSTRGQIARFKLLLVLLLEGNVVNLMPPDGSFFRLTSTHSRNHNHHGGRGLFLFDLDLASLFWFILILMRLIDKKEEKKRK